MRRQWHPPQASAVAKTKSAAAKNPGNSSGKEAAPAAAGVGGGPAGAFSPPDADDPNPALKLEPNPA